MIAGISKDLVGVDYMVLDLRHDAKRFAVEHPAS